MHVNNSTFSFTITFWNVYLCGNVTFTSSVFRFLKNVKHIHNQNNYLMINFGGNGLVIVSRAHGST